MVDHLTLFKTVLDLIGIDYRERNYKEKDYIYFDEVELNILSKDGEQLGYTNKFEVYFLFSSKKFKEVNVDYV